MRPVLVPEDLGIDLDEDTEGFTDDASATETESEDDFVRQVTSYVAEFKEPRVEYVLLRKAGILFCRVLVQGAEADESHLYRLPWLRRTP